MSDVETMVSVHQENTHFPIMLSTAGRVRKAKDHYGDVDCPFCDYVVAPERARISLGDKCKKCNARVVRIAPLNEAKAEG